MRKIHAQSICIIGAGASGLAAAKAFLAERTFKRIVVFEQRAAPGGLWIYGPANPDIQDSLPVPQTDPHAGLSTPVWKKQASHANGCQSASGTPGDEQVTFASPIYDRLETNIPTDLMGYTGFPWPKDVPVFPSHAQVLTYLERYASEVRHLITFSTQVLDVRLATGPSSNNTDTWRVTTRDLTSPSAKHHATHTFDAVYVASGHFDSPYIPDVPGIRAWHAQNPHRITHAKHFRRPETYTNQKVIVVGNSASGTDIASQIAQICTPPLIHSLQSESFLLNDPSPTRIEKPAIAEFLPPSSTHGPRAVRFADETIESDIDAIVYCTGYLYSFPFLRSLSPSPTSPSPTQIITTGLRVHNLYEHIFYIPHPTLAFAVLNQRIIPFQLAQSQSALVSRVWAGHIPLPSETHMRDWEKAQIALNGDGKNFHTLPFPADAEYINRLHAWWRGSFSKDGEGEGNGGVQRPPAPPVWDERAYWLRERFAAVKKTFQDCGEERKEMRTLKDLGFDFEDWKREQGLRDGQRESDG